MNTDSPVASLKELIRLGLESKNIFPYFYPKTPFPVADNG